MKSQKKLEKKYNFKNRIVRIGFSDELSKRSSNCLSLVEENLLNDYWKEELKFREFCKSLINDNILKEISIKDITIGDIFVYFERDISIYICNILKLNRDKLKNINDVNSFFKSVIESIFGGELIANKYDIFSSIPEFYKESEKYEKSPIVCKAVSPRYPGQWMRHPLDISSSSFEREIKFYSQKSLKSKEFKERREKYILRISSKLKQRKTL